MTTTYVSPKQQAKDNMIVGLQRIQMHPSMRGVFARMYTQQAEAYYSNEYKAIGNITEPQE